MAEELEVSAGPTGVSGKFKGEQTIQVLLAILSALWIWFTVIYLQDAKAAEREKARVVETQKLTEAINKQTEAIQKQERTQRTMVYVLTLPQAKRERLNLAEPEQLRELQRYENR